MTAYTLPIPCSAQAAADEIAACDGPVSLLFEKWSGGPVLATSAIRRWRSLTPAEARLLRAPEDTECWFRTGCMIPESGGPAIAIIASLTIPSRLPEGVMAALERGVPLGKALLSAGVTREHLRARVTDVAETSARMWLGTVPVALAWEQVTPRYCGRAAAGGGS